MSVLNRALVFVSGTVGNAVLFLFHSRVLLEVVATANALSTGPGTAAIELLPTAVMIAIGGIQVILIAYLLGAFSEQRTATRRPV